MENKILRDLALETKPIDLRPGSIEHEDYPRPTATYLIDDINKLVSGVRAVNLNVLTIEVGHGSASQPVSQDLADMEEQAPQDCGVCRDPRTGASLRT